MPVRSLLAVLAVLALSACVPGQGGAQGALDLPDASLAALATATPTPSPAVTPTPPPSASPAASASASPSAAVSPSPAPTASLTKSPEPTQAPTERPTRAPTAAPTQAPTATPSPAPTPSPSPSPPATPSPSPIATGNLAIQPAPAPGSTIGSYGKVTDSTTGAPVGGICVTLGVPGALCWAIRDVNGNYAINGNDIVSPGSTFQLYFFTCKVGVISLDHRTCSPTAGYPVQASDAFTLSSTIRKD